MNTLTFNDLPEVVSVLVQRIDVLEQTLREKVNPPKEDTRMTEAETAHMLNIKPETLRRKCYKRLIPYIKQGNEYIFYRSMVEAYEKSLTIQPQTT